MVVATAAAIHAATTRNRSQTTVAAKMPGTAGCMPGAHRVQAREPRFGAERLAPAELAEPILVDAEVMGDLVDDRDPDLLLQHLGIVAELVLEGNPVNGDLVRKDAGIALAAALGERNALV